MENAKLDLLLAELKALALTANAMQSPFAAPLHDLHKRFTQLIHPRQCASCGSTEELRYTTGPDLCLTCIDHFKDEPEKQNNEEE